MRLVCTIAAETNRRLLVGRKQFGAAVISVLAAGLVALPARGDGKETGDKAPATDDVEIHQNISYYDGPEVDGIRHKLDIYVPKTGKNLPVLLFIHGGSWTRGDKLYFGLNKNLGVFCARHGIVTVIPNYRLSPAVTHPTHIKDVARAFAWTHKTIAAYGGRADQMFLSGHSAGGHLAALLAIDETYLKDEGLSLRDVKGVIPMSGIFQIPADSHVFERAFGTDARKRQEASPTWQICQRPAAHGAIAPPFLIIFADQDFALCGRAPAEEFCKALQERKCTAHTLEVKNRNHLTLLLDASHKDDPAGQALLEFITGLVR
jgi:acetyl esterase/lipase